MSSNKNFILNSKNEINFFLFSLGTGYIRDNAGVSSFCSQTAIITKEEIIEWADKKIMDVEDPPFFLFDLSLSKSEVEQYHILRDISYENNFTDEDTDPKDFFLQMRKLRDLNRKNTEEIIMDIFYYRYSLCLNEETLDDIYVLEDYCETYRSGITSLEEMKVRLNSFLEKYVDS